MRAIRLRHLSNFIKVAFFDGQDAENEFAWAFDNMIHRHLKHHFHDFVQITFLNAQNVENTLK
jgi:hypothetical protein